MRRRAGALVRERTAPRELALDPACVAGDLCVHCASTLRGGGGVLLPVYPSGVLYDLLECLGAHLDAAGLAHVPLYVLSEVADASLAYSNILAEWVSQAKQVRDRFDRAATLAASNGSQRSRIILTLLQA